MQARPGLTPERVIDAAAAVADRGGLAAVSMRTVARELGVEAMSLYHHVANKDALLDALADWVFDRIPLPDASRPWREALAVRCTDARATLAAHPWGLGLVESRRSPGASTLRHHDAMLGCLFAAGFPAPLAAHAYSVLDAYVFGFVLTEQSLPFEAGEASGFVEALALPTDEYPHLAALIAAQVGPDYAYADEFAVGLELILDGLEQRLTGAPEPRLTGAPEPRPSGAAYDG